MPAWRAAECAFVTLMVVGVLTLVLSVSETAGVCFALGTLAGALGMRFVLLMCEGEDRR